MAPSFRRGATATATLGTTAILLLLGCDNADPPAHDGGPGAVAEGDPDGAPAPEAAGDADASGADKHAMRPDAGDGAGDDAGDGAGGDGKIAADAQPADAHGPSAPVPIEVRETKRAMMIYPQPEEGGDFRGKLPHGEAFAIYETVEGPDCRGPWGRVAVAGYVCLDDTVPTKDSPTILPRLPGSRLVPFHYAKLRDGDPPAPVWRSRRAMRDGAEPIDTLKPEHVYSFTWRRRSRGGGYLSDHRRRTVASKDVKHLQPSDFAGRDLTERPVPEGQQLAWTLQWPKTPVYATANDEGEVVTQLGYHVEVFVKDEPVRRRGVNYFPLADGTGYLSGKQSRRWLAVAEAPAEVDDDQMWIDVELKQQTLTVMRGRTPVYVTLISSGTYKDPTPTGLYRIEGKMALSDMRSRTGDDEAYHVEDVPWVMYFKGRYALHGAYWHNRFGRRTSHGCINLSALDARAVFDRTAPAAPPGWIMVFEHEDDPGTLLRVRKADRAVEDKRKPLGDSARL
ncbi:MAG: L,D-transpeptidase [Myxococcota bacterium]